MPETSTLELKATFYLRDAVKTLRLEDITDLSALNPNYSVLKGILEINAPNGVIIHNNIDYGSPDISLTTRYIDNITLPRDSNGDAIQGNYIVYYQILLNGVPYYRNFTFNYGYTAPVAVITQTIDGYNSRLVSTDSTNYAYYTINSISRELTVTPPSGSGLVPVTVTTDTVTFNPNIYSGTWMAEVSTDVEYIINGIYVQDTISGSKTGKAYKINFNTLRGYIQTYLEAYLINPTQDKKTTLTLISTYSNEYQFAVTYADYANAYLNAAAIIEILNPTIVSSEEITPFVDPGGGGAPITDDKWNRISAVLSPKVITDKLSIGIASLFSSELLRVLGLVNFTAISLENDDTQIWVDSNGDLNFKDIVTGSKKLSDFVGWNPPLLQQALLESYTNTNTAITNAISASHAAITIPNGLPLTLTGQALGIARVTGSVSGYLHSDDFNTFNGKQAGHSLLTALSGLSLQAGDLLYAVDATHLSYIRKGTTGQFFAMGSSLPQWQTVSFAIAGNDTEVIYNSNGSYAGNPNFTFNSSNNILSITGLLTNEINFTGGLSSLIDNLVNTLTLSGYSNSISFLDTGYISIVGQLTAAIAPSYFDDNDYVTKAYVTSLTGSTFRNGLTNTGGIIQLGGATLAANGDIDVLGTSQIKLEYDGNGTHKSYLDLGTRTDVSNRCELTNQYGNIFSSLFVYDTYLKFYCTDGVTLTSQGKFSYNGFEYLSDYSGRNISNPRWIPDKEYVDSKIITWVDNILNVDTSGMVFRPYTDAEATSSVLYTGTTEPSATGLLNYGGYFKATKLFTPLGECVVTNTPSLMIELTAPTDGQIMTYDGGSGKIINKDKDSPLNSTTCSPGTSYITIGSVSSYDGFIVDYIAKLGTSTRMASLYLNTDGTNAEMTEPFWQTIGSGLTKEDDMGISLDKDVSGGNVRLIIENSNVGDITFKYSIKYF